MNDDLLDATYDAVRYINTVDIVLKVFNMLT